MKKKRGLEALNAIVDVVLAYKKKAKPKQRRKLKKK